MAEDIVSRLISGAVDTKMDFASQATQGMAAGLKLAATKQDMEMQKEKLAMQKEELADAKFRMVDSAMTNMMKMSPAARKRYLKIAAQNFQRAGIPISETSLAEMEDNEALNNYAYLKETGVLSSLGLEGKQKAVMQMGSELGWGETVRTLVDQYNRQQKAEQEMQMVEAQAMRKLEEKKRTEDLALTKEFRADIDQAQNAVKTEFAKITDQYQSTLEAEKGLKTVKRQLKNNEKADVNVFKSASRAIAKAKNSGSLSETDVADFRAQTGFKGKFEDLWNEYIAGDVSEPVVDQLMLLVEQSKENIRKTATTTGDKIRKSFSKPGMEEFASELEERSGLNEKLAYFGVGEKAAEKSAPKTISMKDYNAAIQQLMQTKGLSEQKSKAYIDGLLKKQNLQLESAGIK